MLFKKYTDQIPTTMVSPVAAAEEKALSEMKSEQEKPHVVIRKKNKSRRKRNKQKQISVHKKIKKEKKKRRNVSLKKKSKQSTSKHTTHNYRKGNTNIKYSDSVWGIKK